MARFKAFVSDSEDDSASDVPPAKPVPPARKPVVQDDDEDMSDSGSDSDASQMDDEELDAPHRPPQKANGHSRVLRRQPSASSSRTSSSSRSPSPRPPPRAKPRLDPTVIPRAQMLGVDSQRVHTMQAALFRLPEEEAALRAVSHPTRPIRLQLNRKHSRESDGDAMRTDSVERTSFGHTVEPPLRPTRKYARVESSGSSIYGHEGTVADAGLTCGRSFRVGWGPNGTLVHLGRICAPSSTLKTTANSSVVTKSSVRMFAGNAKAMEKLLQHQLSNTAFETDPDGVPLAAPWPTLNFASLCALYPPSDHSFEASLFRLGQALFDPIDPHVDPSVPPDVREQIMGIRRKAALSAWLEDAVAPAVDADLRDNFASSAAATAFTLLTGNQIERAVEAAMDGGNAHLAALIAQAGGDAEFCADMRAQLDLWREQHTDAHIDEHVRKVYALLGGIVDVLEGSSGRGLERCADIAISETLDWKRAFGLHLWHAQPFDAPLADVYAAYDAVSAEAPALVPPPRPWYAETPAPDSPPAWNLPPQSLPHDALYALIRLHADPAAGLAEALAPLGFGPSPVDYSLPWHLYVLFSRCLRVRDFADRGAPGTPEGGERAEGEEGERVEGHSPTADLLASSYAHQLEQAGMFQHAVFVLMHIEGSAGRKRAIMDLFTRHGEMLAEDYLFRGLHGSLHIPVAWIHQARATYALAQDDAYEAYELYLGAGLYNDAHDVAVRYLAADAVIRRDLDLLISLFERFTRNPVEGWHVHGKVFLDYANVMSQLPELRAHLEDVFAVPDASEALQLEELCRTIPKIVGLLPDIFSDRSNPRHNVALSMMTSDLVSQLDQIKPLALSNMLAQSLVVDEAAKLKHIQVTAYQRFLDSIDDSEDST